MLFLAMKLITWRLVSCPSPADTPIYQASKRLLSLVESAGSVSLLNLQAMILVALYEYGHCIYPAASMTVGACARYGEILGLPAHGDTCAVLGPEVSKKSRRILNKHELNRNPDDLDRSRREEKSVVGDLHTRLGHLVREQEEVRGRQPGRAG